ncbi:hypothetical protein ACTXPR_10885 [Corynebacterium flavescens]
MSSQYAQLPAEVRAHESARGDVIRELLVWLATVWPPGRAMDPAVWFHRFADIYAEKTTMAQLEAVLLASWSVDAALRSQGADDVSAGEIIPIMLASVDGVGRPVLGQAYASAGVVGGAVAGAVDAGESPTVALSQAWRSAGLSLAVATQTMVSDSSRAAKSVRMLSRNSSWVRVLTPPSCSRCAVLAGKTFASAMADFNRHPGCDCTQMPAVGRNSPMVSKLSYSADDYFHSLSTAQQDRIFTKAGAKAIRDGADVAQVVNSRRGMTLASDAPGARRSVTTEGITKRGWASRYLRESYGAKLQKQPGSRYQRMDKPRLMPEQIYRIAGGDRDRALSLLHSNGYLTDASPSLGGGVSYFPRDAEIALATDRARRRLQRRGVAA